ncbi:MAG: sodium-dependent transporter [Rikenellaceae bacterium]
MSKRSTFGNIFGTIAVVGGSVVGLGNIWRFPYVAGENGGAAFILVYICMSLFISIPIMLTEMSIGRAGQSNAMGSFRRLSKTRAWQGVGLLGVITAFIIMSFYSVIAGWSIKFFAESVSDGFAGKSPNEIESAFTAFISSGWKPISLALLFIVMSGAIIMGGVTKGIEKANKILMPIMAIILVGMVIKSTTLSGWSEGTKFLLNPDFSKITWSVALQALGQSFFSMSLGMGAMIIYGSYIKKKSNMFKIAGMVAISDVTIAVLSGLAIFPAVFTFGIEPASGPQLVFITLPNVFAQMSGGYILSIVFFVLLFFAAITSSVSLIEVMVSFVHEEFRIKRVQATLIIMIALALISSACVMSQMPGSTIRVIGLDLIDFNDKLTSVFLMPVGALFSMLFGGWVLSRKSLFNELSSNGLFKHDTLIKITYFLVKYIIPAVILLLFITETIKFFIPAT